MDDEWIDAVMRLNGVIVATEARFNAQTIEMVKTADHGEEAAEVETLLQEYDRSLTLLRSLQTLLLQEPMGEE